MKRKLKMLFLVDFFSFFGGTEYVNYNLLSGLADLGHEIKVCVGEKVSYKTWADMIRKKGIELFISPNPYDTSDDLTANDEFIEGTVKKVIGRWKPDIIFSHPPGKLLIEYLIKNPCNDIPVIAMEYTVPGKSTQTWYHPALPSVQDRISAYIAKCDAAARGIREYFGYGGRIYLLPTLVAKPCVNISAHTGELLSVGCIGRMSPEKGIGFLLGAWKRVVQEIPEAALHLYGHGLNEQYYISLADYLGIKDHVIFEGTYDPVSGIDEIAGRHRIFVQPSLFESIPISLIELMLRKRAVVATAAGGIPELVHPDRGEGILVPPASTDCLAEGMLTLMRSEDAAAIMAEKAYAGVNENYDWDRNLSEYEKVFAETAGRL